jgi:hypothetical protein
MRRQGELENEKGIPVCLKHFISCAENSVPKQKINEDKPAAAAEATFAERNTIDYLNRWRK